VTPPLADEIRRTLETDPPAAGYRVPRVTWHLGRWIRTTDWYPDYQLRLYDRRSAEWKGQYVHESVAVRGPTGQLRGELQHFAYHDIADHLETIDRYTTYAARQMHESGRRVGRLQIAGHPPLAFLRNYLVHGGIRDGSAGLIISALNSYYVFLKFAKVWEMQKVRGSGFGVQGSGSGFGVQGSGSGFEVPGSSADMRDERSMPPDVRTKNHEPRT
jgi:hypothetical protein